MESFIVWLLVLATVLVVAYVAKTFYSCFVTAKMMNVLVEGYNTLCKQIAKTLSEYCD